MNKKTTGGSYFGLENYTHPDKFGEWLGYEVESIDRDKKCAVVALTIREDHLSPAGRVHGGVISALFDFACGASVFLTLGAQDFCSTVELKVNYFRPLNLGDRVLASTQVMFRGKRLCVVQGVLHRKGHRKEDKDPVGIATATFNVVAAQN